MNSLPKNVWILTLGSALMMSASSLVVFAGGIIGSELAPSKQLATLPVAAIIIGTALSTVPVALLMKKLGRRTTFLTIITFSIFIALLGAFSIQSQSFYLFCVSLGFLGTSVASLNQFRFAAMESVPVEMIPKAASTVLLGGIAAAFIGPEITVLGKGFFSQNFSGSFLLLSGLFILGFFVMFFFKNPKVESGSDEQPKRSLREISKQPVFWTAVLCAMVGYAVMSFIMTATPVSMHMMDGHSLSDTKWVIQSHILAMFLPSLITAWIIKSIGIKNMILIGVAAFGMSIGIAYSGHEIGHYWGSLILLGIGWNFLFIAGTTLLPKSYKSGERFKVQALNEFIVFGTQATVALSAGFVVHAIGWENMLLSTAPLLLIPLVVLILNRRNSF